MGLKLTALWLLSIASFLSIQGCGGGEAPVEEKEAATTEAPTTEKAATAAPTTLAPTTVPPLAPTLAPTLAPVCEKKRCDCDQATCEGDNVPAECMMNCDDLLANPVMVLQGLDSCADWEYYYYGAPVCAGCDCETPPPPPPCMAMINANNVMSSCDEVLADANFAGVADTCDQINAMYGGLAVCQGCGCVPRPTPDTGDGYGYGYGFA